MILIVDVPWLLEEVSLLLQQRSSLRRGGTQYMRRLHHALAQRRGTVHGHLDMVVQARMRLRSAADHGDGLKG